MAELTTYSNPIIPGFSPDPSVAFVDGIFFLVNSSFHIFPGLPIYASQDLKTWKHIGNGINRSDQLSLAKATTEGFPIGPSKYLVATLGLFAPTIRYHEATKTFYVICTNTSSDGLNLTTLNFYITTKDIWSDRWSDPTWFDFQGIDPSLFFNDDGKAYIQGPVAYPQDLDGFANDPERPHLYKKDGWYYLLAAEGGIFEHPMITLARSSSPWGPFESFKKNPVLTADETEEEVQHTGHGDIFQDSQENWWVVCLGVRLGDKCSFPLSRETFLTPVRWETDAWPYIEHPRLNFEHKAIRPLAAGQELSASVQGLDHRLDDVYLRDPKLDNYIFSGGGNPITLKASTRSIFDPSGVVTFLGRRQRALECSAEVSLQIPANENRIEAGLTIYKDEFRHSEIFYDSKSSDVVFRKVNKLNGEPVMKAAKLNKAVSSIALKIEATLEAYRLLYRDKGGKWMLLGTMNILEMTACDFTGPIFGIFASTKDDEESNFLFDDFRIE